MSLNLTPRSLELGNYLVLWYLKYLVQVNAQLTKNQEIFR